MKKKTLKPHIASNIYIVNERGHALSVIVTNCEKSAAAAELQKLIEGLSSDDFNILWNECENKRDAIE